MNLTLYKIIMISIVYLNGAATVNNNQLNYLLRRSNIEPVTFDIRNLRNGHSHVTNLDNYRDIYTITRDIVQKQRTPKNFHTFSNAKKQQQISADKAFPCNVTNGRSKVKPDSVDRIKPGDIDIVAAIGDSLSAGMGIFTENLLDVFVEYRGVAFSGGGFGNWRQYLTIPNILKQFNPNLYGFATNISGLTIYPSSHLNIAEGALMSRDLSYQVNVLINRLKQDPHIDMKNHWKLLTIFVGSNDLCTDMCHYDDINDWLRLHEFDLRNALRLLKTNVPRLIVNLVGGPSLMQIITDWRKASRNLPVTCQIMFRIVCSCLYSDRYNDTYKKWVKHNIKNWQAVDKSVAELPEFQAQDFIVMYQPIVTNVSLPKDPSTNNINLNIFASDCMHFSQLGHALLANGLWNNMLQKYGHKQDNVDTYPFEHFECPTDSRPYIATYKNSRPLS